MIRFIASLKTSNAIKIDGDLGAVLSLEVPASEIPEVIKLAMFSGKSFRVNIFEVDKNQKCG